MMESNRRQGKQKAPKATRLSEPSAHLPKPQYSPVHELGPAAPRQPPNSQENIVHGRCGTFPVPNAYEFHSPSEFRV